MRRAERNRRTAAARAVEKALLRPEPKEMITYLFSQGWTRSHVTKDGVDLQLWLPPGKGGQKSGEQFWKVAKTLEAAWDVRNRYRRI